MRLTKAAVLMTLLTLFGTPGALAASEVSEAHAIVEAGASQGTVPGVWDFHPTYSVSVLRLDESGQGFGGRVTLLPSPEFAGAREFSADAVARLANDGPLYLKVIAGAAWVPANGLWPPRARAGAEVGLTAIRSTFGLEAGIAAVYTFPPPRPGAGEWVISAGMGILWGFGAPSRAPALTHLEDPATEQPAWSPGGFDEPHGPVLTSGLGGVVGRPSAAARSETQPLRFEGRDVIHQILLLRKPGDVMSWWNSEDVDRWTQPLSALEDKYIEAMSSPTVPEPIRMWPPVTPESLTADQVEEMEHLWGKLADPQGYSNWKNRHRILKHYFVTHPATIRLLMQLYEVSRDANLLAFSLERGWQMGSGKEMFTDQDVSRLGATVEFFTMLATTVAGGKLLKAARPVAERGVQPPLEPAGSGSAGEVHSPDATAQVIPLDRARTPRTPSSPAARPLPSVDEQPLAATGTDGGPVIRRQAAPGNGPTVASLEPPGQGARRSAATPPSTPQPPHLSERGSNGVRSRPDAPSERPDAMNSAGTARALTEGSESTKVGTYSMRIRWGVRTVEVRPFGPGFWGKRTVQGSARVNAYELKINPNDESFFLPHPTDGFVQFEKVVGHTVQDGKLVMSAKSVYHVADMPAFARTSVLEAARRQVAAASQAGFTVEWLVSEQRALIQLADLFKIEGIPIKLTLFPE